MPKVLGQQSRWVVVGILYKVVKFIKSLGGGNHYYRRIIKGVPNVSNQETTAQTGGSQVLR